MLMIEYEFVFSILQREFCVNMMTASSDILCCKFVLVWGENCIEYYIMLS